MYYHYHHCPKYRCSTCGRRCGANGHAGCGNAELINDLPDALVPLGVWFIHFILGCIICPVCWFIGWDVVPQVWGWLGWFLVVASIVLVVAAKVTSVAEGNKHKGEEVDNIKVIAEGMKAGKTADVIMQEME